MTPLAQKIKQANDSAATALKREVPEWGLTVWIKSWSGADRKSFLKFTRDLANNQTSDSDDPKTNTDLHAEVCARGLVDETGTLIFNGDASEILSEKSAPLVETLADEILEHNGLGKRAQERASKNLRSSQSLDSGTDSLAT